MLSPGFEIDGGRIISKTERRSAHHIHPLSSRAPVSQAGTEGTYAAALAGAVIIAGARGGAGAGAVGATVATHGDLMCW